MRRIYYFSFIIVDIIIIIIIIYYHSYYFIASRIPPGPRILGRLILCLSDLGYHCFRVYGDCGLLLGAWWLVHGP